MIKKLRLRMKSIKAIICWLLIGLPFLAFAQDDIDFSIANNPDYVYPETIIVNQTNVNYSISPINLGTATGATIAIFRANNATFSQGCGVGGLPACSTSQMVNGITINAASLPVTLTGVPNALGTISFRLEASADSSGVTIIRQRNYVINVVRGPIALGFVLDQSGSMGYGYDGNHSPPANQRRWDGLVTGVGAMAAQFPLNPLFTEDRVGVVLFSTDLNPSPAPFNVDMVSLQTNHASLATALAPLTPDGWTALGKGIIEARDRVMTDVNNKKVMVIFSDGDQNQPPSVDNSGATIGSINISDNGNIDVYTICLGTTGAYPALMASIANVANGSTQIVNANDFTNAASNFNTSFLETFVTILSGNSPQFIDKRQGTFIFSDSDESGLSSIEESFSVNKGSQSISLTLFAPHRNEPQVVSLIKNGINLIQYASVTHGSGFVTVGLKLPVTGQPALTLDGDWTATMRVAGIKNDTPYTLAIITDDHVVDAHYDVSSSYHLVGDTLNMGVILTKRGSAIDNAQVEVIVAKPGDDINDLIALADVNFDLGGVDPGSPAEAKLAILLNDPAFLEKIKMKNQLVTLHFDSTKQTYVGSFEGLDVTGPYQLYYKITADDSEVGKIRRYHHKSIYVRFPDVDLANSAVNISINNSGNTILTWRPKSSNGKFIGSGWGSAITIDGANITEFVDHGDGSYTLTLDVPPSTDVTINIMDEEVYQGKLEDFGSNGVVCKILGIPCWLFWTLLVIILLLILWLIFRKK